MANTATELLEGIASFNATTGLGFQENEVRPSIYGALDAVNASTPQAIPASELMRIKEATRQTTSLDVFVKEAEGSGTARKCAGTGGSTTANVDLTYATFVEEFQLSEIEHQGNRARFQETFNHMFTEKLKSMYSRVDAAAIAFLEANKSAGDGSIFTTLVGGNRQIELAASTTAFNDISTEMHENDFSPVYYNVASTSQRSLVAFNDAQGSGNQTNLAFQGGDYNMFTTNRFTPGVLNNSESYIFTPGTVGLVTWTNLLSRQGADIGTDVWSTFADPAGKLGNIELKVKNSCFDNSGSFAGAEADKVTSYVMAVEVAFVPAFTSDANTGIYHYDFVKL